MQFQPTRIELPVPPMGGKCWVLDRKGLFVLEEGPGTLRTIACTHAGSGQITVYDGLPSDNGFFPDEQMAEPARPPADDWEQYRRGVTTGAMLEFLEASRAYHGRRGRPFYKAHPVVMGSWMLDAGFHHGLTILASGEHQQVNAVASIVWMPFRRRG